MEANVGIKGRKRGNQPRATLCLVVVRQRPYLADSVIRAACSPPMLAVYRTLGLSKVSAPSTIRSLSKVLSSRLLYHSIKESEAADIAPSSAQVARHTQSPWNAYAKSPRCKGSVAHFSSTGSGSAATLTDAKAVLLKAGFDPASFREQQIAWGDQDPFQCAFPLSSNHLETHRRF